MLREQGKHQILIGGLHALNVCRRRLEGDLKPCASCVCDALQRLGGRPGAATLEPGNNGLGCLHALGELILCKAGFGARLDERTGETELGLKSFVSFAVGRPGL